MKKVLIVFGGLCAAAFIVLAIFIAYAAYAGHALDRESKAYADAAILAIASQWNEQDLTDRASPQLMASVKNPADLDRTFGILRTLGSMRKYDGSKGDSNVYFNFPRGKTITAVYVARVEFDHGTAMIKISLIKLDNGWKILGFNVVPDSFPATSDVKPNI